VKHSDLFEITKIWNVSEALQAKLVVFTIPVARKQMIDFMASVGHELFHAVELLLREWQLQQLLEDLGMGPNQAFPSALRK